jgi:hypothetical protein
LIRSTSVWERSSWRAISSHLLVWEATSFSKSGRVATGPERSSKLCHWVSHDREGKGGREKGAGVINISYIRIALRRIHYAYYTTIATCTLNFMYTHMHTHNVTGLLSEVNHTICWGVSCLPRFEDIII